MNETDLISACVFVGECERTRLHHPAARWMLGTSSGGDYVARLLVDGQPYEGKGVSLCAAVQAWGVGKTVPQGMGLGHVDATALRAFVDECERGRGKVDRLWWMLGTLSGGRYMARVQLAKVQHQGDGVSLADAINALGTKLLALGVMARKR